MDDIKPLTFDDVVRAFKKSLDKLEKTPSIIMPINEHAARELAQYLVDEGEQKEEVEKALKIKLQ